MNHPLDTPPARSAGDDRGRTHAPERGGDPDGKPLPSLPEECTPVHESGPAAVPGTQGDTLAHAQAEAAGRGLESVAPAEPASAHASLRDLLASLIGQQVTVIDAETFEEAPVGHRIHAESYLATVHSIGGEHVVLDAEFVHRHAGPSRKGEKETIQHFVPFNRIKKLSLLRGSALIHI